MATTTTPTPIAGLNAQDQAFMDGFYETLKDSTLALSLYKSWGTILSTKPTFSEKLAYIRDVITFPDLANKYKVNLAPVARDWLAANHTGMVDADGKPFTIDFLQNTITGDAKTQAANEKILNATRLKYATEYENLVNPTATKATKEANALALANGSAKIPFDPTKLQTTTTTNTSGVVFTPTSMTFDELKSTYGGMNDPTTGKPLFSDTELKAVADAKTADAIKPFNTKLNSLANQVLDSQNKSVYTVQSPTDRAAALKTLLGDPSKLVSSVNALYNASNPNTDTVASGTGIDLLKNYRGGSTKDYSLAQEQAMIDAYDPNKGTWSLPTVGDKAAVDKSPFGSYVQNMLTSYANKGDYYSPGYVSSVEMPETPKLTNISKPFDQNPTSSDLLKLVNSAGTAYDPTNAAGSSLSPVVRQLYQPQKNADGSQAAKPGVPDPTKTVIPTTTKPNIDTSNPLIQVNPDGSTAGSSGKDTLTGGSGKDTLTGGTGNDTVTKRTSSGGVSDLFPKELYDALKANGLEAEQTGSQKSVDDWYALRAKYGEDKVREAEKQLRQDAYIDTEPKRHAIQDVSKQASIDYQDTAFNIGQKEKAYYQSLVDKGYTGPNDVHALYLRDHPEEAAKDVAAIDTALKNSVYAQNAAYFDSSAIQKPYTYAWGEPKSATDQLSSWLAEQQQVINRLKNYDTNPSTDPFASSYRDSDWSRLNFLNTNIGNVDPSKVVTYTPATSGNASTFTPGKALTTAANTITGSTGKDSISGGNAFNQAQAVSTTNNDLASWISRRNNALDFVKANANDPTKSTQVATAQGLLNSINADINKVDPTKVVTYSAPATTNPYVAAGGIGGTQAGIDTANTVAQSNLQNGAIGTLLTGQNTANTAGSTPPASTFNQAQTVSANNNDLNNWISRRDNALAFINANANDPTKAANIASAQSVLNGYNTQIGNVDPTKVVAYTPTVANTGSTIPGVGVNTLLNKPV